MLDTKIIIYPIQKKDKKVLDRFKQEFPGTVVFSLITVDELEFGVSKSEDKAESRMALYEFLSTSNVLALDKNAAKQYGEIWANFERAGTPVGPLDALIAAHAKSLNLTLVSNN
jgi:tRNA(fMet)-specific endonuclease VapC